MVDSYRYKEQKGELGGTYEDGIKKVYVVYGKDKEFVKVSPKIKDEPKRTLPKTVSELTVICSVTVMGMVGIGLVKVGV